MSNLDDDTPKQDAGHFPPTVPTAPPVADVEKNSPCTTPTGPTAPPVADVEKNSPGTTPTGPTAPPATDVQNKSPGTTFAVSEIVQRWKREDFMKSGSVALTGLALLFSLLSFIVMAANNHGDGMNFNQYETYRYALAIAILSTVYTGGKAFRRTLELWAGKRMFQQRTSAVLDFFGDQIMAYLLISAASSAASLTNLLREAIDGIYTDSSEVAFVDTSSASISMAFLAFFALAISAMISGYKLSTQSYI